MGAFTVRPSQGIEWQTVIALLELVASFSEEADDKDSGTAWRRGRELGTITSTSTALYSYARCPLSTCLTRVSQSRSGEASTCLMAFDCYTWQLGDLVLRDAQSKY